MAEKIKQLLSIANINIKNIKKNTQKNQKKMTQDTNVLIIQIRIIA